MEIFDTHCHLNDKQLYKNIDVILERAKQAGITKFLVCGWDKKSSELAVKIANKYKDCYAAVGVHPENIEGLKERDLLYTLNLSKNPKVVAIGEIGLDYHYTKENAAKQKEIFIKQILYANENNLPVVIHNREAFEDCLKILTDYTPKFSGTLHCYSGSVESLKSVLNLGLYIGLDGPVTFKNSKTPKEVAKEIPLERLLLETDSPYLSPHPLRGTINEPSNIRLVLDAISEIKNVSKKHVAEVTYNNAIKLFKI